MTSITDRVDGPAAAPASEAPAAAAVRAASIVLPAVGERELRLDLFRGLALWLIFIDHLPPSLLTWFTIRNYGFSDATEIFIFISGYTAAFVYGRALLESGFVVATARILRRAWQIYVAHIFLFTIFLAEISYLANSFENPLYIVLMLSLPLILVSMRWRPDVTLTLSALLYAATLHWDLYFSAYPNGYWSFNPLAWQLLFEFGAWCALGGARRMSAIIASNVTLWICVVYLAASFYVTLTWYVPA